MKALNVCRCDDKTNALSPVLTIHSAVLRYFKKGEVQMQSKKYVQIQRYIEKKIELKYLCVDHKKDNFRCKGKIGGRERKCIKIDVQGSKIPLILASFRYMCFRIIHIRFSDLVRNSI